jgi:hypothetical protein
VSIKGYRELSTEEVAELNKIKTHAEVIGTLIDELKLSNPNLDFRWVAIATTQLQQGFMALARAVARPTTF